MFKSAIAPRLFQAFYLVSILFMLPATAAAQSERVQQSADVEIIIAVNASLHLDLDEAKIQRMFLYDTIRNFKPRDGQAVSMKLFIWAGQKAQLDLTEWTLIENEAQAEALADVVFASEPKLARGVSISGALSYAREQFDQSPFNGARRVIIVISASEADKRDSELEATRDQIIDAEIEIAGMPLMMRAPWAERALDEYFEKNVLSPGAPMEPLIDAYEYDHTLERLIQRILR